MNKMMMMMMTMFSGSVVCGTDEDVSPLGSDPHHSPDPGF